MNDYDKYDGIGLRDLIRQKEVTAQEVLEAAISVSKERNKDTNSIVMEHYDISRQKLEEADSSQPLYGVPTLIKDSFIHMKGTKTQAGSRLLSLQDEKQEDSILVTKMYDNGMTILGKTNTPEFGIMSITDSELYGKCYNYYDRDKSVGGSSGGAASAVRAGMVPIAHATDAIGSARVPAACCNVIGFKPTTGRFTRGPNTQEGMLGLSENSFIARSMRDIILTYKLLGTYTPGDMNYPIEFDHTKRPLNICVDTRTILDIDGPYKDVEKAIEILRDMGHNIQEDHFYIHPEEYLVNLSYCVSQEIINHVENNYIDNWQEYVENMSRVIYQRGKERSIQTIHLAKNWLLKQSYRYTRFMENYDIYLTPSLALPPLSNDQIDVSTRTDNSQDFATFQLLKYTPFTALANITQTPSISYPIGDGVLFTGKYGHDKLLLSLLEDIERHLNE